MKRDTFQALGRLGGILLSALALSVVSLCTTKSDVAKNPDSSCDLSQPREVTFKTYRACEDCARTIRHAYRIASEKGANGKEVITISSQVIRPTSHFSSKGTMREFRYEADGRTLDAALTTQHNILGYRTDPDVSRGDVNALVRGKADTQAYDEGMQEGLKLIKEIESRAKCTMPRPAQPGVGAAGASW